MERGDWTEAHTMLWKSTSHPYKSEEKYCVALTRTSFSCSNFERSTVYTETVYNTPSVSSSHWHNRSDVIAGEAHYLDDLSALIQLPHQRSKLTLMVGNAAGLFPLLECSLY
ncbi:hypothetical protein ABVT39_023443 [Epinephelus coioides]